MEISPISILINKTKKENQEQIFNKIISEYGIKSTINNLKPHIKEIHTKLRSNDIDHSTILTVLTCLNFNKFPTLLNGIPVFHIETVWYWQNKTNIDIDSDLYLLLCEFVIYINENPKILNSWYIEPKKTK